MSTEEKSIAARGVLSSFLVRLTDSAHTQSDPATRHTVFVEKARLLAGVGVDALRGAVDVDVQSLDDQMKEGFEALLAFIQTAPGGPLSGAPSRQDSPRGAYPLGGGCRPEGPAGLTACTCPSGRGAAPPAWGSIPPFGAARAPHDPYGGYVRRVDAGFGEARAPRVTRRVRPPSDPTNEAHPFHRFRQEEF
uniref:Uncharacterized protein n=1 Tax=Marseillevirus LCMAC103 TaxID=2506604 RepID=A0A481YW78_9VIRU|nr:MAG: hypothetical protein LCMAC103_03690 [Marseillevirus LCMAC103]